jgi:hypothetical protein
MNRVFQHSIWDEHDQFTKPSGWTLMLWPDVVEMVWNFACSYVLKGQAKSNFVVRTYVETLCRMEIHPEIVSFLLTAGSSNNYEKPQTFASRNWTPWVEIAQLSSTSWTDLLASHVGLPSGKQTSNVLFFCASHCSDILKISFQFQQWIHLRFGCGNCGHKL